MFSDYSRSLLRQGIIEAKAGNKTTARRYLDRAIYMSGSYEILAEAWFWMSEISDDPAEKRKALENCLSLDMLHTRARRALALLDGKLQADEIVNPDALPADPSGPRQTEARRFMCPKCGGRMYYAPDGSQKLICDYCSSGGAIRSAGAADEKDFIVAMAAKRGHARPLQEQAFHCRGCGAEFILPPGQISAFCLYCDSPHVVNLENAKDLLAPDGIIPYQFDQRRAVKILIAWVEEKGFKPEKKADLPRGLYLPLWTFDVGGAVEYAYEYVESQKPGSRNSRKIRLNDSCPVVADDFPIPASRKLSGAFIKLIPTYDLKAVQSYDPRFLVGMPAEIYDVPMADASLDARSQVYETYRRELPRLVPDAQIVHTSSAKLLVESFKLVLLPVWMTELSFGGRQHLLLINGQTGAVASEMQEDDSEEKEAGGLWGFLSDLFDS